MRVNTVIKIRFLLALLTIGFFVTALTIRLTYDRQEVLIHDGREIERSLHQKERLIHDFLQEPDKVALLQGAAAGEGAQAEQLIAELTDGRNIYVYLFRDEQLLFWSSEQYVPRSADLLRQRSPILRVGNGWYRAIYQPAGTLEALFLIPVKSDFQKHNEYLSNQFSPDLIGTDNLEIADYNDRQVYNIRDIDGNYLFSVKLDVARYESFYSNLELAMWVLGALFTLLLIQMLCLSLARSRLPWTSVLLFGLALSAFRWIELEFGWFNANFNIGLFDPRYYASSRLFPHLGGFLFNILLFTWWSAYIFAIRRQLWIPPLFFSRLGNALLLAAYAIWLYMLCSMLSVVFSTLINHSDINFDVTDILHLDLFGWLGVFSLCIGMSILSLNIGWMVHIVQRTIVDRRRRFWGLLAITLLSTLVLVLTDRFSIYFILIAGLVWLRTWHFGSIQRFGIAVIIANLLVFATISALKHTEFHRKKRQEAQKRAILMLESVDDAGAVALFFDLEREILRDSVIIDLFQRPGSRARDAINTHLKSVYFSGYLSRYDFIADSYDAQFRPFGNSSTLNLSAYRDKVISGAIKVSGSFYRQGTSFGSFEYFAQFPIYVEEQFLGILLIDMKNRAFSQYSSYPGVLADGRLDQRQTELISTYSTAFYRDGELINQSGRYVYPVVDSMYYPLENRQFKSVGTDGGYSHMAYKPDQRTLIILGKPEQSSWMQFASASFFFLVFMLFVVVVYFLTWLIKTLSVNDFNLRNLRWSYLILKNRTLYSTRIQFFVVFAVVFTLITTGVITYFSVSSQFTSQQELTIVQQAWEVAKKMESHIIKGNTDLQHGGGEQFVELAEAAALDMNLYDTSGKLIYTTQPRIYDLQLISDYLNARAFVHLQHYQRSRYVHEEHIGKLNYLSAYASLRNSDYEPIAFLSLPNYSSRAEFDRNLGGLLNTLINIYALIILTLGLFAVFVANKITAPLLLVQRSLSKTKIGKPNEPIFWKRNDEIGSLIKEYNLMIAELEHSAEKLMQSERESAWKEMAKQVAHEIKNPLTPLKLGIQQLERSWKDKDPGFEERFNRFIVSFVEQIDSLTRIATEFSDFAKMPDTDFVKMDLKEVIRNSVAVFDHLSNVTIRISEDVPEEPIWIRGDRDQFLRAFNNLIKNAVEATVGKRKCVIEVHVGREEGDALVSFKDNGAGISPEVRKKMFQPNFTTKSSGTGLGLAFVRRTVESVEGSIVYQTALGKGTTFVIRIPLYG